MVPRTAVIAVVCCWLLIATPLAVAVGSAQNGTSTDATGGDSDAVDRCFPGEGYEFTIGTQGPEIGVVLHLSLLANPAGPGAFGVELTGSLGGPPIVELRTGVISDGIESVGSFLNDPFGPFSIAFDYRFGLPMFGSGFEYEESDPPIEGPVDGTAC